MLLLFISLRCGSSSPVPTGQQASATTIFMVSRYTFLMIRYLLIAALFIPPACSGQELFVYSQPASVLPAKSISVQLSGHYVPLDRVYSRTGNRLWAQVSGGVTKKLLLAAGLSYADMHTPTFRSEGFWVGGRYRFLSHDAVQRHFRMAAFANAGYTQAHFHYDEVGLMGDKTGVELGLIATQLRNRLALSGSISHTQLLDRSRFDEVVYLPQRFYQTISYSLAAGYRGFPNQLLNYRQLNINFYVELLAQQTLPRSRYFIDAAPAVQFIFNSSTKVAVGPRLQLAGTMDRMSKTSWLLTVEKSFLNVFK